MNRTVICFVFLQADNLPDIPPQTVTEEKFIDEQGNMVVKKVRPFKQQHHHHQKYWNQSTVRSTIWKLTFTLSFYSQFIPCLHQITRKVIRKYVSADGMETQEVTIEGSHQETVQIEEGDSVSRVVKRTVLHSEGDQKEVSVVHRLL